jgi:hypothetical protein
MLKLFATYISILNKSCISLTQASVNITQKRVKPIDKNKTVRNMNASDYYRGLDYALKMLFKSEVLKRLKWSPKTFHRRMKEGGFRPGELLIINDIIIHKSFLKLG